MYFTCIHKNVQVWSGEKSPAGCRTRFSSRTSWLRPPHEYSRAQSPCVPLRDDATRQLRVPIAAAACQCDEDWHSGKLSLKIPLFPFPINQTIWAARKNAPGRGAPTQPGLRGVFSERKQNRQISGKNKNKCVHRGGGGKNMSAFWGQRRIVEKRRASVRSEARQSLQLERREGGSEGAAVPARLID